MFCHKPYQLRGRCTARTAAPAPPPTRAPFRPARDGRACVPYSNPCARCAAHEIAPCTVCCGVLRGPAWVSRVCVSYPGIRHAARVCQCCRVPGCAGQGGAGASCHIVDPVTPSHVVELRASHCGLARSCSSCSCFVAQLCGQPCRCKLGRLSPSPEPDQARVDNADLYDQVASA